MEKIEIDLEDDAILALALEAHRRDIKLNDYMVEIILNEVEKEIKDAEQRDM